MLGNVNGIWTIKLGEISAGYELLSEDKNMALDKSWVDKCVQQCVKSNTPVTDAALIRLNNLLKGKAQERSLTPTETSSAVTQLMRDMVGIPKPTDGGGNAH